MAELLLAYTLLTLMTLPDEPGKWFWLCFGLTGNAIFGTRFLLQWIHSEKHGESRVPTFFWWQSIAGTIILLIYFLHRRDPVGIIGYVLNVIPYTRSLMLVYRKKRADELAAAAVVTPVSNATSEKKP
jgi:lipid-A-disaccharide synthase-like uncharacterized protein